MTDFDQKHFCANPWYHYRINADGAATHCGRAVDTDHAMVTRDFFQEFNQNPHLQSVRAHYASNQTDVLTNCVRCQLEEQQGVDTYRHRQNAMASIQHGPHFQESVRQSHVLHRFDRRDLWPQYLFVKFGNECDLHCRMCNVQSSSSLNQLFKQHLPERYNARYETSWAQDPELWQNFCDFLIKNPVLTHLQYNGGELLQQDRFKESLRLLVDHGKTNLRLIITSNCIIYDQEFMDLVSQFTHCTFDLSIDTMTPVNDYVRPPSQYQEIINNIEQYVAHRHRPNFLFTLHVTPQVCTIDEVYTVFDYALDRSINITANKVWPQRHLDFIILPATDRERLTEFYRTRYAHLPSISTVSVVSKRIQTWLNLPVPEDVEDLRRQFVQETLAFDSFMGGNFLDYFPQYTDFFNQYR